MGVKHFSPKRLTIAQQVARMSIFPQFRAVWKGNRAAWTGPLRPTGVSEEYQIEIAYTLGVSPQVSVLSPELRDRADGTSVPHVYPGYRLCLFLPGSNEWYPDMFIADTIVPWASLWLYFYEVWYATGKWLGGGVHPKPEGPGHRDRA